VQIPAGAFSLTEPFFVDRVLAVVTLLCTACLLHAWTMAIDAIESQSRKIGTRNEDLRRANDELLRLKEEVTRQNEELEVRRSVAEEASTRKTRLLATVSHDIRSPLHAINLMAQIIKRSADDPMSSADVPRLAQRLQANVLSAADLVTDILDISSIDSGQITLHESEFSLDDFISEECRRMLPIAEAKNLSLEAEPSTTPVCIRTDHLKLARILNNLVANAIKFTESGGVVLASELTPRGTVVIRVRDSGIGIKSEYLDWIFDEFSQVRDPESQSERGWGLGLAICRRLTDAMGGSIAVESRPNVGSVFSVELPSTCIVSELDECQRCAA
jgi:signal transduction histidine kinase